MRLVHISDLHFGHHNDELAAGFAAEIDSQSPDLIVASGDFTQLGSRPEFEQARAFLLSLRARFFAVPGNHDIPHLNVLQRFLDPYGLYRRYISDELEPFLVDGDVAIAGLKTSRRMRLEMNWAHGAISEAQLEQLAERFAGSSATMRIVVAHHPLLMPEGPFDQPLRAVDRADLALAAFSRIGVQLVLSGHFHLSYVRMHEHPGATRVGEPSGPREATVAPIIVAQASSTTSTRLRGHANAYNVIDIEGRRIDIRVRAWTGSKWATQERDVALT
jgi:3',5'-cyclic AMP phosphodiesterase CpdA